MFSIENRDKIKEYLGENSKFRIEPCWDIAPGFEGICLRSSKKVLRTLDDIIKEFKLKTLYCNYNSSRITKCAFIKFNSRVFLFYEFKTLVASNIDAFYYIDLDVLAPNSDLLIYESEKEYQFAVDMKEWKDLGIKIESAEKFLSDPWEEYRAKEKAFKEKLNKIKAATEYKIKTMTKTVEVLKNRKKQLEDTIVSQNLLGEKENREGN